MMSEKRDKLAFSNVFNFRNDSMSMDTVLTVNIDRLSPADYMLNRKEVCHLLGLTANTKTLAGWNVTRYVTADLYNPSSQYSLELEVCYYSSLAPEVTEVCQNGTVT